jgi:transposase
MGKQDRFTDEFKQDAVAQVVERGYAVSEVAERLGISTKSLYTWKALFSKPVAVRNGEADLAAELRRVKKELVRVTEERDILKERPPRTSRANPGEVRVHQGSSGHVFRALDVPGADGACQRVLRMA